MKILLTSLFIFLISSAFAQDGESSVWLINGKKLTISNYKFVENGNYLAYEKKPGRVKEIDRMDIFSITDFKGNEEVFFNPDTLDERFYTVENMRSFVAGGYDGFMETKAVCAFISGFILGVAGGSGYIINNPFYGVIIPAAGVTIVGLTNPSMEKIKREKTQWADDDFYLLGYQESAKQVRVIQAIKGSLAGIVVGVVVGILTCQLK